MYKPGETLKTLGMQDAEGNRYEVGAFNPFVISVVDRREAVPVCKQHVQ